MFGQAAAAAVQATKDEGADADDDNEEPPKEEIKQVVEDDAIHSVRYNWIDIIEPNHVNYSIGKGSQVKVTIILCLII